MSFEISARTLKRLEWSQVLERLCDQCRTPQGRSRFTTPGHDDSEQHPASRDSETEPDGEPRLPLEASLASTRILLAETTEARALLDDGMQPPLGGASDPASILERAERGGLLSAQELLALGSTLGVIHGVVSFLKGHREKSSRLWDLAETIEDQQSLESEIRRCIDESGEVSDRASPELAAARSEASGLSASLQKRLTRALQDPAIAPHLSDEFVTVRNDRYVLPVKAEAKGRVPGIVHDASNSGTTLFIEPEAVVELNNRLKETELRVARACERVIRHLSEQVGRALPMLRRACNALGDIDLAFARGHLSQQMDAVEPRVERDGEFETLQLRHPLLSSEDAVANDFHLGTGYTVLILSGPNAGGKTVAMKSVGLAALFVRAGLHVPAQEGARVPLVDHILADIGDEQDIRESLSTFSAHMANLAEIVRMATKNSLVLLDEVGVGTDPGEGSAIAQAVLESLADRGTRCIATTHYSLLKELAALDNRFCNASVDFDPETLAPTYRLRFGISGASSATTVAARMGMPLALLERANTLLEHEDRQLDGMLSELASTRAALEREKREASELRFESEAARDEYQRRLERLQERRDQLFQKMRTDLDQAFGSAHEQIADVIRKLQSGESGATAKEAAQARQKILELERQTETEGETRGRATPPPPQVINWQKMSPGQPVSIIGGGDAILETLPDRRGRVAVRAGTARLILPADRVARAPDEDSQAGSRATKKPNRARRPRGPSEDLGGGTLHCDLRGLRVDEALDRVVAELDRGAAGNHAAIEFIHGFGTGALRKAVRDHLKHSPYVARIQSGNSEQGGDGVTLAMLDAGMEPSNNEQDEN
jgi:DNA mismatch repair protein MutS2